MGKKDETLPRILWYLFRDRNNVSLKQFFTLAFSSWSLWKNDRNRFMMAKVNGRISLVLRRPFDL